MAINSYTVYRHTFPNGKVYIGLTSRDPHIRWGRNGCGYKNKQPIIQNAIMKFGWDNIKHEILFTGLSKEEAEETEINLINQFKSDDDRFGYNGKGGGFSSLHKEATKKKISEANRRRSPELVRQIAEKNSGKVIPNETRKKISERLKGITRSEETRAKMSASKKGIKKSAETRMKMSQAQKESRKIKKEKALECAFVSQGERPNQ